MQVKAASTDLCLTGSDGKVETQLLRGDRFTPTGSPIGGMGKLTVFGKADSYPTPGWVNMLDFSKEEMRTTHWVCAARTVALREPDIESPRLMRLSMNAQGRVTHGEKGFSFLEGAGWVPRNHIAMLGKYAKSPANEAHKFLGTPYLWGGCDACFGLDCSGLICQVFLACGIVVPRNSGDQQQTIGDSFERYHPDTNSGLMLELNDLVFWPGHVAIVADRSFGIPAVIHAVGHDENGGEGMVVKEYLDTLIERLAARGLEVTCYRRPKLVW